MTVTASNRLAHFSQLDGLRCIAVVMVMIGHWIAWDTPIYLIRNIPWGHGVMLFFVLSGYLISTILFDLKEKIDTNQISRRTAFKTFYIRRVLRIFPAYYFLIALLIYLHHDKTRELLPWLLTYTTNLLECKDGQFIGEFNHFWSLAVEEQFYLIWPCVILFVNRKHILKTILLFMLGSLVSRGLCFLFIPNWMVTSYFTLNLFFPLCLGALMAYARNYHEKLTTFFNSYLLMWAFLLFYAGFYYLHMFVIKAPIMKFVFDEFIFSIAMAFVIFRAASNNFKFIFGFVLSHDIVVYGGKISYSLYLYHLFIIGLYWNYLAPRFQIDIHNIHTVWVFYFIMAFFIASFSYYVIEVPFNKLKNRFKY